MQRVDKDANTEEVAKYLLSLLLSIYPGAQVRTRLDSDGYWEIVTDDDVWMASHSISTERSFWILPGDSVTGGEVDLTDESGILTRFKDNHRINSRLYLYQYG